MRKKKSLICTTCGSNDIQIVDDNYCVCKHCGTKIILDNNKTNITNNEINLLIKEFDGSLPFYELETIKGSDEFLRDTLVDLAKNKETPSEIFDIEYEPVKMVYRKISKIDVDVDVSYSASIGYDRKETYRTKERVYNREKGRYENEIVENTRIVTDWEPISGSKSYSYSTGLCLDSYDFDEEGEVNSIEQVFPSWVTSQTVKSFDPKKNSVSPEMPSQKQIDDYADVCASKSVKRCKSSLPGDSIKNFNYSARESKDVKAYVVPQYVLQYELKGVKYSLKSLAGSRRMTTGSWPNASNKVLAETTKETMPLIIASFVGLLLSILTSFIFFIVSLGDAVQLKKTIGLILSIGFCVIAIALSVTLLMERKKIKDNIILSQQQQKITSLKVLFEKLHFSELSSDEINGIENMGGKK